jgi:hypothetical protein
MLQVVPRVSQLTQDSYGYQYASDTGYYNFVWGTKQASYKTAGFLDKLMDFGFEIARSNPTVVTGLNSSAEWVDTLWEGKTTWTNKEKESVAIGMSDWMDGFRFKGARPATNDVNTLWSDLWVKVRDNRALSEKAFDYAGRLMQASRAIDDVNLKPAVKKADFLSHLVNLGGSYAISNPNTSSVSGLFLDTVWGNSTDSQKIGVELTNYLKKSVDFVQKVAFDGRLLYTLKSLSDVRPSETWKNASDFKTMLDWGSSYWQDAKLQDENLIVHDPGDLFKGVWDYRTQKDLSSTVQLIAEKLNRRGVNQIISNKVVRALYVNPVVSTTTSGYSPDFTEKQYARRHIAGIMQEALTSGIDGMIVNDAAQIAYILATASIESRWGRDIYNSGLDGRLVEKSGRTPGGSSDLNYFKNEAGGTGYDGALGNQLGTNDYYTYRGRGYVQLTGKGVYKQMSSALGRGAVFVDNPSIVEQPEIAVAILIKGMMENLFTLGPDSGLASFVDSAQGKFDWNGARSLVNPLEGSEPTSGRAKINELAPAYYRAMQQALDSY